MVVMQDNNEHFLRKPIQSASTHTIAALATPPGRGALAVIRLSGDSAHDIFARVIAADERERFYRAPARKVGIYTVTGEDTAAENVSRETFGGEHSDSVCSAPNVIDEVTAVKYAAPKSFTGEDAAAENVSRETFGGEYSDSVCSAPNIIDEVTAVKYAAPKSFTGEDTVEIFSHGGAVIPQKILDRLFHAGARAAGRGEFTRRAWANGKIDLLKAESIAGLIDSQTETHLKSAQLAYSGKQLESIENLKRGIIGVLSDIENRIEFAEESDAAEHGPAQASANLRGLEAIVDKLEEELRRSDRIRTLDDGIIIALAGPPNAGKSSLFNEILGYDRSIVHDSPGTTRDAVSEKILFDGITVKLFDCAGIRDTEDAVETRGIERAMSAVKDAHIVIWVTSADTPFEHGERDEILGIRDKTLVVINKIDLAQTDTNVSRETFFHKQNFCESNRLTNIPVSIKQKINIEELFYRAKPYIRTAANAISAPEIVINARHRVITTLIIAELQESIKHFEREEICAHYLKNTLNLLAEFLGNVTGEEVLNEIFGKFCVGK